MRSTLPRLNLLHSWPSQFDICPPCLFTVSKLDYGYFERLERLETRILHCTEEIPLKKPYMFHFILTFNRDIFPNIFKHLKKIKLPYLSLPYLRKKSRDFVAKPKWEGIPKSFKTDIFFSSFTLRSHLFENEAKYFLPLCFVPVATLVQNAPK